MNDMVMHFATSNKVACGRNNHNLQSVHGVDRVSCKACRNTEAYRAAVAAATTPAIEPAPVAAQVPAATSGQAPCVAFGEWLRKLGKGDRLPRGPYFAGKQAGDAYNESALHQLAQKVEEMAESLVPDE